MKASPAPVVSTVSTCGQQCVCVGFLHLFGHLGGAGAQLPGVSDVSQHQGKRAKGSVHGNSW